jgi:NarL family two-component system response regulator LiaR
MEKSMSKDTRIRIMIVDDHSMMRTGLRYTLESFDDLELVGEASSGSEALELCQKTKPDVILMDMVMPEMDGAETTQHIQSNYPSAQIIALTSFQERDLVERALQSGAIGYLLKNVPAEELVKAIRAAYKGKPTLSQEATEALIESTRQKSELGGDLTDREREVLGRMVKGLTNAQIAEGLMVSESTVKFHVRNILSKLGAANRTEAVNLAWQHKLVKETGPLT